MAEAGAANADAEEIDPVIARFAAAIQDGYASYPDLDKRSMPERREIAEAVRAPWRMGGPAMAWQKDLTLATEAGPVPVRIFDATGEAEARAALIYAHGGGFVSFSLTTHDRLMREYAARTGALVIGVDYALSPEAKFPIAHNQMVGVFDWLAREGKGVGVDPARIAAAGDSAGANLALGMAIALRDRGAKVRPTALVLNYGFFDADFETASHHRHGGEDKMLTTQELGGFLEAYLADPADRANPLALPALSALHDLPPSFHVIAQCDPLADGDRAMADKLRAAGGDVEMRVYPGATHSFLEAVSISPLAERALAESSAWLAGKLA
ncbi:MAG TPA: alpha/beta hydrolase fold domain-containing protein [Caulobacteraceae bacterium]|nr:alpha/beta hydrolase fold domain-containing protein [Caulobacteraceae bacterium]